MSISRILENQLVIMEALSELLPSKNRMQPELELAASESTKELALRAKAAREPTAKELEEILNLEVDGPVTVNLDGSVTSGIHGFISNHEGVVSSNDAIAALRGSDQLKFGLFPRTKGVAHK